MNAMVEFAMLPQHSGPSMKKEIKHLQMWMWHLVEEAATNPQFTIREIAKKFNKHENYISILLRSDLIQARISARRAQLAAERDQVLSGKLHEVAVAGLDLLQKRLTENTDRIGTAQVIEATSNTLKSLGYGVPQVGASVPAGAVVNNTIVVPASVLEASRERLRQVEAVAKPEAPTIDRSAPPALTQSADLPDIPE